MDVSCLFHARQCAMVEGQRQESFRASKQGHWIVPHGGQAAHANARKRCALFEGQGLAIFLSIATTPGTDES
jgi:hypothetical protein